MNERWRQVSNEPGANSFSSVEEVGRDVAEHKGSNDGDDEL